MAAKQPRKSPKKPSRQPKAKGRWIPKLLLLLGYTVLVAVFVALFIMQKEVHRIGLFGSEKTSVRPPTQPKASPPSPQSKAAAPKEKAVPAAAERIQERKAAAPLETRVRKGAPSPSTTETVLQEQKETAPVAEITLEEKEQLDDILRREGGEE
ncbi:MAG: hypothetical protein ACRERD_20630 [Candidatus Binatia bacterium]